LSNNIVTCDQQIKEECFVAGANAARQSKTLTRFK
jgi:hypothetical protein